MEGETITRRGQLCKEHTDYTFYVRSGHSAQKNWDIAEVAKRLGWEDGDYFEYTITIEPKPTEGNRA